MQSLPPAFAALGAYRQFVPYFITPSKTRPGKTEKIPYGSTTDPATWLSFDEAVADPRRKDGIGFVFTDSDPLWFLDVDAAWNDQAWSPLASQLYTVFKGCGYEISQSQTGMHFIGSGQLPPHGCRNKQYGLELYHTGRFVALTGIGAEGNVLHNPGAPTLNWLVETYFSGGNSEDADESADMTTEPCAEWAGTPNDDLLIERMLRSSSAASAFGGKASFADLWEADPDVLSRFYPPDPNSSDPYGRSEADAALAQHLAFWTGKHGTRMERIMMRSGLVREKWHDREGYYLPLTIRRACARQRDVLHDKPLEVAQVSAPSAGHVGEVKLVEGSTFVSIDQQLEFFKGCTYVVNAHRVLTPDGSMLRPEQFSAKYGGFSFPNDAANQKMAKNAWDCFTNSQVIRAPRADATMFRPDLPPGFILNEGGYTRVNSYVPVIVARTQGDATPIIEHLARILPVERDRQILMAYLAACVQYPGKKFRWAPLLQGAPGNGKTLFTYCLIKAMGERYCHLPSADNISEKFNSWLFDKLLIGVEDVYTEEFKGDLMEVLKPMITGEFLAKRAMQSDQIMQNSCANFIFNTNHKNGLRKDRNDRRIAPLFCAQQNAEDLIRDGLTPLYFVNLYGWLERGGYAIVTDYLMTYAIPDEFNPAGICQIAPHTSSTASAIEESLGGVEQEIIESITRGDLGFRGDFISSEWLARLLERIGASRRIHHKKRLEILDTLGYEPHRGLPGGRATRFVLPDAVKSRLFVRKGSEAAAMTDAELIAKEYEKSNNST